MTDVLGHFHFLQPLWLLLAPVTLWALWRHAPRLDWPPLLPPPALRFPALAHLDADANKRKKNTPPLRLLAVALLAFIVALAQPVVDTVAVRDQARAEPVDLALLVGTAVTMGLRDYSADGKRMTRMAMLKALLDDFVIAYSGRRLGLVALGDPPAVWLPLTPDKAVARDAIARLRTGLGGRLSDTGGALKLLADDFFAATSQDAERIVVLVTDAGMQLGSLSPEQGARRLARQGVTLHTIAIGGNETARRDPTGLLYTPVDFSLMERLAALGHGKAFRATDSAAMRAALREIERMHRQPAPPRARQLFRPLYPWFIGAAMLLLLVALLAPRSARP